MPSFTVLAAALVATTAVVATPVNIEKRSSFTIEQVQGTKFLKNGAEQKMKTLRKFGKPVPQSLIDAAAKYHDTVKAAAAAAAQSGTDSAVPSDSYDSSYLSPVSVGGTTLHLDFDSGSSDLWVFSSLQSASQRSGHSYYTVNPAKVLSGQSWKISYGDGSGASGKVYADTVVIGGVTATSQAVEAATSVSAQFSQDTGTDGLVGLAQSSINTVTPTQQKTFFDNVKSSLAQPLFAAQLKYHGTGSYDFGTLSTSKYTGSITYVSADTSQGFWGVTASDFSISGAKQNYGSFSGIVDTGTTLIYTDDAIVSAYYAQVSGSQNSNSAGGWVFPCSAKLPSFGITIGGVSQVVPGSYINYAPADSTGQTCFGGIQSDDGIGFSIFGDIFIKSKYVVFKNGGSSAQLGFAQQAGVPTS